MISLVAQMVKSSPLSAGDSGGMGLIPGLGRSPGKGMATHSSVLAWEIPWTEEPGGLQSVGSQVIQLSDWATTVGLQCYINFCSTVVAQLYIHILFDYGLSHNTEYSSLCCKYSEALLSIHLVYSSLHLLIPDSQPTLPPWQPQLCSSCLLTDFFFIFICTAAAAAATAVFWGALTVCQALS